MVAEIEEAGGFVCSGPVGSLKRSFDLLFIGLQVRLNAT